MAGGTKIKSSSIGSHLDLKVIDESYGRNADLYEDVLGVPTTATQDEIQLAYFERRSELFTLLTKIDASVRGSRTEFSLASADQQRYLAERKMDSVVFAVRILADPSLRKAYNRIRPDRTGVLSTAPRGYTMAQAQQRQPPNGSGNGNTFPVINPSNSTASESSTKSDGRGKQRSPRVVTPPETLPLVKSSSSASESKNWIQSTFSGSIFSSISSSHSRTEDEGEEYQKDEERNPRKSKRRSDNSSRIKQQRQQQQQTREPDPDHEPLPETSGEKEKKFLWGRKKRKKKKQIKNTPIDDRSGISGISLNDSMGTNATDTSSTDHEESYYRKGVRGTGSRVDDETVTMRDDDTRTYLGDDGDTFATFATFASGSIVSDDEVHRKAVCCDEDGMFGCISGSRTFQKIATEVSGACEDTLVSVDQVFNAFTLTDKDIKAVTKKIVKAKRQLDN